jgi:hypothetical protein
MHQGGGYEIRDEIRGGPCLPLAADLTASQLFSQRLSDLISLGSLIIKNSKV